MKKFIMACGVALMALGAVSCSDKNASADNENAPLADSIAQYMGTVQGADLAKAYAMLDSAQKAGMSKDGIIAGIKTVLMADTADQGYLQGLQIGFGLLQQATYPERLGINIDRKTLFKYYAQAFKADSVSDIDDARKVLQNLMGQLQQRQMQAMKAEQEARAAQNPEAKKRADDGVAYLAKIKNDPAYKTTTSGIAYKVDAAGNGDSPKSGDTVKVKYTGRHVDGSEFDSSKGEPVAFPVDGVVPGFAEALKMMKPGAKYTVVIPADLAYGPQGTPDGSILPNETLVFDIELVGIDK